MTAHLHRGATTAAAFLLALVFTGCTTGDGSLINMLRSPFSLGCCGLLVLILDVIAIIEVVGSARTMGSKVLWIVLIIIAPLLGCIIYYFFGR